MDLSDSQNKRDVVGISNAGYSREAGAGAENRRRRETKSGSAGWVGAETGFTTSTRANRASRQELMATTTRGGLLGRTEDEGEDG